MTFVTVSAKNEHFKNAHERILRYPCDSCSAKFLHKCQLRKHVDIVHDKAKAGSSLEEEMRAEVD